MSYHPVSIGPITQQEDVDEQEYERLIGEAEARADQANERHFEERGYWDAREQEDYESQMGVW